MARWNELDVALNDAVTVVEAIVADLRKNHNCMPAKLRALAFRRPDVRLRLERWDYSSAEHRDLIELWARKAGYKILWTADRDTESNRIAGWEEL